MKNKNKWISAVLTLALMLSLSLVFAVSVYGAAPKASIQGPSSVAAGDEITLKLQVSSPVSGYAVDLEYDENQLELKSATAPSGWTAMDGDLRYTAMAPFDANYEYETSKNLLTFTFRVKSGIEAGSKISVKLVNIYLTEADLTEWEADSASWSASVAVPKSSDATLKSLTVEGYKFTFKPGTVRYKVTVPNEVTNLIGKVSYELNDPKATAKLTNPTTLKEDDSNRIRVYVTAEDGTEKTYTIVVAREPKPAEPEKSSDCTLKSLSVSGATLNFSPSTMNYTLEVENEVEALDIQATPNHSKAKVEIRNNILVAGETVTVQVVVTAENGDIKTYKLQTTRKAATVTEPPKSTDNTLKALQVEGVDLTFDPSIVQYVFSVENSVERLVVHAEPNHAAATCVVDSPELTAGAVTTVTITVTAEDGTTRVYTLAVTRKAATVTEPPISSEPIDTDEPPQETTPGTNDEVTEAPTTSVPQNPTVFWLNAIYIIILVGCLLVIALLLVLLVIYRRMNNNMDR